VSGPLEFTGFDTGHAGWSGLHQHHASKLPYQRNYRFCIETARGKVDMSKVWMDPVNASCLVYKCWCTITTTQERQIRILLIDELEVSVISRILNRMVSLDVIRKVSVDCYTVLQMQRCTNNGRYMSQFQLLGSDWTITAALDLPPEVPAPHHRTIFVKSPATQCLT